MSRLTLEIRFETHKSGKQVYTSQDTYLGSYYLRSRTRNSIMAR